MRARARTRVCVCVRANPFYWGSLNIHNSATHAFQFYPLNRATFKIKYRLSSSQHVDLHKLTFRRKICTSSCINLPVIALLHKDILHEDLGADFFEPSST